MDSDISVTYSNPLYSGMGGIPSFDSGFVMWGIMAGGTTAVTVHKGQLVVDVIDAAQKKLVWRGIATDNLSDNRGETGEADQQGRGENVSAISSREVGLS